MPSGGPWELAVGLVMASLNIGLLTACYFRIGELSGLIRGLEMRLRVLERRT